MSAGLVKSSFRFYDRLKVVHINFIPLKQPKTTTSQTGEVLITDETEEPDFISNGPESHLMRQFQFEASEVETK